MTGIRDAAAAAYQGHVNDQTTEARAVLGGVIAPDVDVDALHLADAYNSGVGVSVSVFTDGDVHLAVRKRGGGAWQTILVAGEPGDWTELAPFTSLWELGKLLNAPSIVEGGVSRGGSIH